MKKILFALFFAVSVSAVYSFDFDFLIIDYLPSLRGRAAGTNTLWNRFEGREDESTFSLPIELKLEAVTIGPVKLAAIAGYTIFTETDVGGLASCNVSLGLGIGYAGEKKASGYTGFYTSLYPLYEFPIASFAGTPIAPWKMALDVGFGTDVGYYTTNDGVTRHALYACIYTRIIGAYSRSQNEFYITPDFGIALGFHLEHRPSQKAVRDTSAPAPANDKQ